MQGAIEMFLECAAKLLVCECEIKAHHFCALGRAAGGIFAGDCECCGVARCDSVHGVAGICFWNECGAERQLDRRYFRRVADGDCRERSVLRGFDFFAADLDGEGTPTCVAEYGEIKRDPSPALARSGRTVSRFQRPGCEWSEHDSHLLLRMSGENDRRRDAILRACLRGNCEWK